MKIVETQVDIRRNGNIIWATVTSDKGDKVKEGFMLNQIQFVWFSASYQEKHFYPKVYEKARRWAYMVCQNIRQYTP